MLHENGLVCPRWPGSDRHLDGRSRHLDEVDDVCVLKGLHIGVTDLGAIF
jgi:hypothetical protein